MSSNTQQNTDRPFGTNTASTGDTGIPHGTVSGTNSGSRAGFDSSPLAYDQGTTTTAQHDSHRLGEEGQKHHHGHGMGTTGVGHHKSHQEATYVGQDARVGGDMKTTSETFPRSAEQAYSGGTGTGFTTTGSGFGTDNQYSTTGRPSQQHHAEQAYPGVTGAGTYQAYSGVTGDPLAGSTTKGYGTGDTTGRYGNTATSTVTGTDNQYPTTGLGGSHGHEVTDTGVKPSMTDKIVGGVEKVAGKMTSNAGMYQKGAERASGETANLKKP